MALKSPPRPVNDNHDIATEQDQRPHDAGMRVAELDFPAQFALWGMRAWLAAWRQDENGTKGQRGATYRAQAGEGFLRAGVPQAMDFIDDIFQVIAAAAIRQIDLRCPPCGYVSADEALLLGAIAASQRMQHAVAWSALGFLLPPAAARVALPSLISLAVTLRDAEMMLTPLDAERCVAPDLRLAQAQASAAAPIH